MEPATAALAGYLGNKVFGKTLDKVGGDISKLYDGTKENVKNIISNAAKKLKTSIDSNEETNLRVTRDVLWNGSFADDPICIEYFGGILASSRSKDGKNDTGIFYLDIIKSLSSDQLRMHYIIYRALNKLLILNEQKKSLNPGQENELNNEKLFFVFSQNFLNQFGSADFGVILHGLSAKNIIGHFQTQSYQSGDKKLNFYYCEIVPKSLGVQLFAIANNQFQNWKQFSLYNFEDFEGISLPEITSQTKEDLVEKLSTSAS